MRSKPVPLSLKNLLSIVGILTFVSSRRFSSHDAFDSVSGVSWIPCWCSWGGLGSPWRHFGSYLGAPNAFLSLLETAFQLPDASRGPSGAIMENIMVPGSHQGRSRDVVRSFDLPNRPSQPQNDHKLPHVFLLPAFRSSHTRLKW